ncbi:ribosomal protein S7 domain-containing protein [Podospora appendiculata]|uniref:Small ribosomal subunit protein uS7m n=1 Tax=Podospora appendiculata TaxID=314037 RepID=A0AAE1C8A3_9PEZI|nr:ribosomal protein S7 domain-containing protein [Podospora appendiculata]
MPPRLNLWPTCRALAFRTRPANQWSQPCIAARARSFADRTSNNNNNNNTTSSQWPEHRNADIAAGLPPSMLSKSTTPEEIDAAGFTSTENEKALSQLQLVTYGLNPFDPAVDGHKYGLPDLPLPSEMHMKHRYDPAIVQFTKLLMQDGKLSKAQRDMAIILNYLRSSPPPKINPARPLVPGSPPASHLPLDPVSYLTLAIDSVAPLIRIRAYKGLAGGGASLDVPMPLAARQRRRTAFQWILDAVNKKKSKGSGRTMFPHRVAEEIVAVVEGRSSVWDKRHIVHKLGTSARANLNHQAFRRR